jgi:DNA-directed RNA polymerase subunit M/transcription elongation factor TFIIS
MLHYTCDSCGRELSDQRFIVRVEIAPAFDPDRIDEADLDADNLQQIAETIEAMQSTGEFEYPDCGAKTMRYDLCPACRERFAADPLGQDSLRRLSFSQN